jgi:hypothetical protein
LWKRGGSFTGMGGYFERNKHQKPHVLKITGKHPKSPMFSNRITDLPARPEIALKNRKYPSKNS